MHYDVSLANNLLFLQPDLAEEHSIESPTPLTPREISSRIGIHPLLLVASVIEEAMHPLDQPVETDVAIILMGPVAGG
jgi:hypothetical protein